MRTKEVADTIGATYRQMDYLARHEAAARRLTQMTPGSGRHRSWEPAVVVRLALAYHLSQAVPLAHPSASAFPELAAMALDAPPPPRRGYAVISATTLQWAATWADARRMVEAAGVAVIATYDLDNLLGDRMDVDAALGHAE